jgi:2-amino-4-hydroxy-6-hydroxymethyldihydropteridine diphosphokinase
MSEQKTHRVYLSIGSNIGREGHVGAALDALDKEFTRLILSKVYESTSIGFSGENFYNLVVGIDSVLSVAQLAIIMRSIEQVNGRRRNGVKFGPRTLDIDILTYDNCAGVIDGVSLPRDEILENAFVLMPLADIAGDDLHPVCQRTYRELADHFDLRGQKLWAVDFIWRGKNISAS